MDNDQMSAAKLQAILTETIHGVRDNSISIGQAQSVANATRQVLALWRLQIDYARQTRRVPHVPELERDGDAIRIAA